jgi:hypothetical protein
MSYLQVVKIRNKCPNVAELTCIVFSPSTHQLLFDKQIGDLAVAAVWQTVGAGFALESKSGEKSNLFYM